MANPEHLEILKQGVVVWNRWRIANRQEYLDLRGAELTAADLHRANLRVVDLGGANLSGADLCGAELSQSELSKADLRGADLRGADLHGAFLHEADLRGANLSEAYLHEADLRGAKLTHAYLLKADLSMANLSGADLTEVNSVGVNLYKSILTGTTLIKADLALADFRKSDLSEAHLHGAFLNGANFFEAILYKSILIGADLQGANLSKTDLSGANLSSCKVFGISAWDPITEGTIQSDLIITENDVPIIRVDNLEVAQFVYLLINNQKLRDVIHTVGEKAVLILGRFSDGRIEILYEIRDHLREKGYLPIIFDFERATERDFIETVKILAGMALFVITDITNPHSNPLELQATIPDYMVPFVPILQKGEQAFSMFRDLQTKYDWVMDVLVYDSKEQLIEYLDEAIIKPALHKHNDLLGRKEATLRIRNIDQV